MWYKGPRAYMCVYVRLRMAAAAERLRTIQRNHQLTLVIYGKHGSLKC